MAKTTFTPESAGTSAPPAAKQNVGKADPSEEEEEKARLTVTIICVSVIAVILALVVTVLVVALRRRHLRRRREKKKEELRRKLVSERGSNTRFPKKKSWTALSDETAGSTKQSAKESAISDSMTKVSFDSTTRAPSVTGLGISEHPYSHSAATAKSASVTKLEGPIVEVAKEPSIIDVKNMKLIPIAHAKRPPKDIQAKSDKTKPPTVSTAASVSKMTGPTRAATATSTTTATATSEDESKMSTARTKKTLSSASALPPTSFGDRTTVPPRK